jgi:hypothetical protein
VGLAHCEVEELDALGLADEGLAFEVFLLFCHVGAVGFFCFFFVL